MTHTLTVATSTYDKIKRDIIFGILEPSTKLKLGELKNQYDASVSTLRETLNRLASDGFVTAEEQRGFFVAPVSKDDLSEIASLRALLECFALEESIKKGDTDWEGNLVAAYHKLSLMEQKLAEGTDGDTETWKRYDWEFHKTLIQACNSSNLMYLHSTIYDKYLRYQIRVSTIRGSDAADEHKTMFEAALQRDAETAKDALRKHIQNGLKHALALMD